MHSELPLIALSLKDDCAQKFCFHTRSSDTTNRRSLSCITQVASLPIIRATLCFNFFSFGCERLYLLVKVVGVNLVEDSVVHSELCIPEIVCIFVDVR